jgi:hydroxyethylthiazole kinase-like uncharacterized protein yjeF
MTELLTAAQMRALEQAAIARGEVTGLELMERAGQGVVEAILDEWPAVCATPQRALVICGPGNNGGDGFVVARLLQAAGWEVKVCLYGEPGKMPPDARVNYDRWNEIGEVERLSVPLSDEVFFRIQAYCLRDAPKEIFVIDALFGTGLRRAIRSNENNDLVMLYVELDDLWMNGGPTTHLIAIDVPSGLCADSGKILCPADSVDSWDEAELDSDPRFNASMAELTVTFHARKLGHVLGRGPQMCGKLRIADIGLNNRDRFSSLIVKEIQKPWAHGLAKQRAHKFSHGHALIVSGDHGRSGAARLAARGALRVGAGLVTVASPPAAMAENAARLDAIMLREVAGADALAGVLADKRINALCLGPGMGTGPAQADLLAVALAAPPPPTPPHGGEGRRLVLDADALTLLSQSPKLSASLTENCILTPHAGEFARLFPDIAERLAAPATKGPAYSKVDATREAAARAGCVVLYKGPDTVIAEPSGRCAVNAAAYDRAAPWLATAGSGDVLAGFITGLLARGFSPFDAACTGAWVHAECAREFGPGLIAEDLPEALPKVFRAIGV